MVPRWHGPPSISISWRARRLLFAAARPADYIEGLFADEELMVFRTQSAMSVSQWVAASPADCSRAFRWRKPYYLLVEWPAVYIQPFAGENNVSTRCHVPLTMRRSFRAKTTLSIYWRWELLSLMASSLAKTYCYLGGRVRCLYRRSPGRKGIISVAWSAVCMDVLTGNGDLLSGGGSIASPLFDSAGDRFRCRSGGEGGRARPPGQFCMPAHPGGSLFRSPAGGMHRPSGYHSEHLANIEEGAAREERRRRLGHCIRPKRPFVAGSRGNYIFSLSKQRRGLVCPLQLEGVSPRHHGPSAKAC